jgi:cysteinyl-tRNA synthetase
MLNLFNSLGKKIEPFEPVNPRAVGVFTCGPSVYQRAHIGNFRTFLFEDIVVRYLEYSGYRVRRGMNFTDVEDKAIKEGEKQKRPPLEVTEENIVHFLREMELLRIKTPDYLPRASEAVDEAAEIIEELLRRGIAYRHGGNIYFDPLTFPGFGAIYDLDMSRWPSRKRRFHKDTYPGIQWNLGDFILWHGFKPGDTLSWETSIGRGRPSWNVQDPSMIVKYFNETLSIYCGGYDNLFRHHDYLKAILESVRPYPMARFWLHGHHLYIEGQKMSKSKGNVYYVDTIQEKGYTLAEIRFFLIYGQYRKKLNYTDAAMAAAARKLRSFKARVKKLEERAGGARAGAGPLPAQFKEAFVERMDDDLDVRGAFDELDAVLTGLDASTLTPGQSSGILKELRRADEVLKVLF